MVDLMYGYKNMGLHPAIIFIAFYLESSHPTEPGLWSIELSQPPDKLIQINSHGFSNKEGKFEPIGNCMGYLRLVSHSFPSCNGKQPIFVELCGSQ